MSMPLSKLIDNLLEGVHNNKSLIVNLVLITCEVLKMKS